MDYMDRIPVDSSNITSIGYDEETTILEIEFKSGSIYAYYDVPFSLYVQLMNAPSKGKFFNTHIKMQYYDKTRKIK